MCILQQAMEKSCISISIWTNPGLAPAWARIMAASEYFAQLPLYSTRVEGLPPARKFASVPLESECMLHSAVA